MSTNALPYRPAQSLERSITITNASGSLQSYALFAALPEITPAVSEMSNNVILVLRGVANASGQAYFTIPDQPLYAVCGTSYSGETNMNARMEVFDLRPIRVGHKAPDGILVPGTTLEMVARTGIPSFATRDDLPLVGNDGCFCVRTSSDFTNTEARAGKVHSRGLSRSDHIQHVHQEILPANSLSTECASWLGLGGYVVGLSLFKNLSRYNGPMVTFRPAPSTEYQIKPLHQYYLVAGDYISRTRMPKSLGRQSFVLDFNKLESNDLQVFHTEQGQLVVKSNTTED